jgi:hypothetical protein
MVSMPETVLRPPPHGPAVRRHRFYQAEQSVVPARPNRIDPHGAFAQRPVTSGRPSVRPLPAGGQQHDVEVQSRKTPSAPGAHRKPSAAVVPAPKESSRLDLTYRGPVQAGEQTACQINGTAQVNVSHDSPAALA